jgi:hypothetical protein
MIVESRLLSFLIGITTLLSKISSSGIKPPSVLSNSTHVSLTTNLTSLSYSPLEIIVDVSHSGVLAKVIPINNHYLLSHHQVKQNNQSKVYNGIAKVIFCLSIP